jgi:MinD-like ATPase involved in chromosome partitioning or flagellar assembly
VVVARPDVQEVQATAVLLALAEQLGGGRRWLVVNQAPAGGSHALCQAFARTYRMPVATVLPLVSELAAWHSDGFFVLAQPTHPWSMGLRELLAAVQRAGGWRGLARRGGGHDP